MYAILEITKGFIQISIGYKHFKQFHTNKKMHTMLMNQITMIHHTLIHYNANNIKVLIPKEWVG